MASKGPTAACAYERVFAIDLGTTYSCVALWNKDTNVAEVAVGFESGKKTLPSMVAYTGKEILVGEGAKTHQAIDPRVVLYSFKRFLGRTKEECEQNLMVAPDGSLRFPFTLVEGRAGSAAFDVSLPEEPVCIQTPVQVSSLILGKLKSMVEDCTQDKTINECVITVPVSYNHTQRNQVYEAAGAAGLKVLGLLNEPLAACLAYNLQTAGTIPPGGEKVLVWDLGGGTFDITIAHITREKLDVLANEGDPFLGGDDFDNCLVTHFIGIINERRREKGLPAAQPNPQERCALKNEAEALKQRLTVTLRDSFTIESIMDVRLDGRMTRVRLNEICKPMFDRCQVMLRKAMATARLDKKDITKVVLVGGSSRMDHIGEIVAEYFGRTDIICKNIAPDQAIAMGALYEARRLKGVDFPVPVINDRAPYSLGVAMLGDVFSIIIPKHCELSKATRTEIYGTVMDNQTSAHVIVLQGEDTVASRNKRLGDFRQPVRAAKRGEISIPITFKLNPSGMLECTARAEGVVRSIRIENVLDLTEEERVELEQLVARQRASEAERTQAQRALGELAQYLDLLRMDSDARVSSLRNWVDAAYRADALPLASEVASKQNEARAIRRVPSAAA